MVLKATKKRFLCGLSYNSKTKEIISIKFYITGPCILFWGGGGGLWPNTGHGLIIHGFLDYTQQHTTVRRTPLDK